MLPWAVLGTLGAIAAVASGGKRSEGEEEEAAATPTPAIGYAPAKPQPEPRSDVWPIGERDPTELEETLLAAGPVDLDALEADEPTVGMFYQTRRGETLLGEGPKSIVWVALYNAAEEAATFAGDKDPHAFARSIANHPHRRVLYANLITAGSTYNDLFFGTWGYGPRDFVGPHGRALCLRAVHSDTRQALLDGVRPTRTLSLGTPADHGSNRAVAQSRATHPEAQCRPYPWLPMLNLELLYHERQITSRGCLWPGTTFPCSEPPADVWRLIGAQF